MIEQKRLLDVGEIYDRELHTVWKEDEYSGFTCFVCGFEIDCDAVIKCNNRGYFKYCPICGKKIAFIER